jgi:NAD-dependent dihydropyrimidine dehydrogenase PreA subunit
MYPDNCIGCRLCEMLCPDFAIEVEDEEVSSGE